MQINTGKLVEILTVLGFLGGGLTFGWNYVGKPWAQELIDETVDARMDALEEGQRSIAADLDRLVTGQQVEAEQSEGEASALQQILCRIQAEQNGSDPSNCTHATRR